MLLPLLSYRPAEFPPGTAAVLPSAHGAAHLLYLHLWEGALEGHGLMANRA